LLDVEHAQLSEAQIADPPRDAGHLDDDAGRSQPRQAPAYEPHRANEVHGSRPRRDRLRIEPVTVQPRSTSPSAVSSPKPEEVPVTSAFGIARRYRSERSEPNRRSTSIV